MTFKVKKSGSFAVPAAVKRKASGSWTNVGFVKVKKSGVWEQVWPVYAAALVGAYVDSFGVGGAAISRYTLTSGGLEQTKSGTSIYSTVGTWLLAGAAADYEARVTTAGFDGATKGGDAVGSWVNLGTTREWTLQAPISPSDSLWEFLVEIRPVSGSVIASATVTLSSERP